MIDISPFYKAAKGEITVDEAVRLLSPVREQFIDILIGFVVGYLLACALWF